MSFEHSVVKVFIGKDIDRVVGNGESFATLLGNIVAGEVVVLDKDKSALVGGTPTVSTTDTIYIVQGMSDTYTFVPPSGTASTARAIRISDPIKGSNVKTYVGTGYSAKAEKEVTIDFGSVTVAADTEYVVRFVYKDVTEHPGQFTSTYRVTATSGMTGSELSDAFAAAITKHKEARVTASSAAGVLTVTAKPIPDCTTSVEDIDRFSMVDFDVFVTYVDSDGNHRELSDATVSVVQEVDHGNGTWEQVRDLERSYLHLLGVRDVLSFPARFGDPQVVKGAGYDLIMIEHDAPYVAPNNQGAEVTPIATIIAIEIDTATGAPDAGLSSPQETDLLTVLNSWMASTPKAFASISL